MKKFIATLAFVVLGGGLFSVVPVSAQAVQPSTCTITSTGPGSTNSCTVTGGTQVTVVCTNSASLTNVNLQNAVSGSASVNNNTNSISATTGPASNANDLANDLALGCGPAATTTTTTTPQGGQGAATPAPTKKVAALPNTGGISPLEYALGAIAATSGVAAIATVAIRAQRQNV